MAKNIKYTRASVLSDSTFEFMGRNPTKIAGDDDGKEQAARALQGLNELQKRGKGSISAVSLSCGLQYLREQAPLTDVSLLGPECDMFADDEATEDFRRVRRALKSADWLLWVIGTGDRHYVVIVLHLDSVPTGALEQKQKKKRAKRQVREWAVVDPTGDHGAATRTRRVTDRLQALASTPRLRVDELEPRSERGIAVPGVPGHDAWSSGLRAFGVVDAVLQRLTALAFRAAADDAEAAAAVWAPMPLHFNGVRARNDMMAACAHQALRATEWGLRLALVSVRAAPKGGKKGAAQHQHRPAAHEERFEPARGFGSRPDDVWNSDHEGGSEAASPVGPLTPVSTGPSSRASSPPPAPSKKRKTYRVPRVTSDEDEDGAEPAPKRRKTSSTGVGSPVGSSVAKKSRAFVASAACTASPTPSDGLIETSPATASPTLGGSFIEPEDDQADMNSSSQALGDEQTPCGTDKPPLPESMAPNAPASTDDKTMVDAPAISDVSTEGDKSAGISQTVPESMAPAVNDQAMMDAPSTLHVSTERDENASISHTVPESMAQGDENANISHTVPEPMAPSVNGNGRSPANIDDQAMVDAPSTLQVCPVDGEGSNTQIVPESPFSEEE